MWSEPVSRPHTALLIGAGFSKWSCDLPLVLSYLLLPYTRITREERRVIRLKKIYERWRAENPVEHCEGFVRLMQGPLDKFNLTNWYITRRLSEPFIVGSGRRFTWYINSYHPQGHNGIEKVRNLLALLNTIGGPENLGILTTNYDLIPEYALGTRRFNYGVPGEQIGFTPYPYPKPLFLTGAVSIAKLHGSISWDGNRKFPDSRCGLTGKCLIVPPITEKQAPKALKSQWGLARKIISRCHTLIVFGFSFNEYDAAIRKFFKRNLSSKSSIIFIDTIDHRGRLAWILGDRKATYLDAHETKLLKNLEAVLSP